LDANITFETVVSSCSAVENSTTTSDASQAKPANCEPQPDAFGPEARYREVDLISDAPIQSVVRWFNPKRGFGFVILSDGSGDAFLHRNVLAQPGIDAVEPRAVIKVRIAPKDQGLQVVEVLSVDNSGTVPATQSVQKRAVHRKAGHCKIVQCEAGLRLHRSGRRWQRRLFPRLDARTSRTSEPVERATCHCGCSRMAARAKI
jgi:cold shock CspA family protein